MSAIVLCLLAQTTFTSMVVASPRYKLESVQIMTMVRLIREERVSGIPSCLEAFEAATEQTLKAPRSKKL
jgi:hypothetical protein